MTGGRDVYGARRDREREAARYAMVVLQKQMTKHPAHEEGGRVAPGLGFVAGALADGRPS